MRLHPRKIFSYVLLSVGGVMFLATINYKTGQLDDDFRSEQRLDWPADSDRRSALSSVSGSERSPSAGLWLPGDDDPYDDRIVAQMLHVPRGYARDGARVRHIYVPGGLWDTPMGQEKFVEQRCPVDRCSLTTHGPASGADAVLVQNSQDAARLRKRPGQIWILWLLESPMNSVGLAWLGDRINWTASYRADSTIVTPYERFLPYDNSTGRLPLKPARNYADGKTKLVAWFVSNCNAANRRLEYARQLRRYVGVDVYGACGELRCARGSRTERCDLLLRQNYKFYLSFENSNCEYYITEKLFWNALFNDVVPVVMGARKSDYLAAAPPHSFIHVEDFASAQQLAEYLLKLDKDDRLYNQYFLWKSTGRFINTKFWCRLCAMLHDPDKPTVWFPDVERWWRHNGSCTRDRWDRAADMVTDWRLLPVIHK